MKVKFVIVSDSSSADPKSNIITVRAMQIVGEEDWFLFPKDSSSLVQHLVIAGNTAIMKAKNAIKKRGQRRTVTVTLTDVQKTSYFDEEGNPVWNDEILETVPFLPKNFDYESPEELPKPLSSPVTVNPQVVQSTD